MRISDWSSDVCSSDLLQALGLSIAQAGGASALPSYVRLIEIFENNGQLDRRVEGLASNEELLRRIQEGQGLPRPELAILLSTATLTLQDAIERHRDIAADPTMIDELAASFPPRMHKSHAQAIPDHQLRGYIIATMVAKRIVN